MVEGNVLRFIHAPRSRVGIQKSMEHAESVQTTELIENLIDMKFCQLAE